MVTVSSDSVIYVGKKDDMPIINPYALAGGGGGGDGGFVGVDSFVSLLLDDVSDITTGIAYTADVAHDVTGLRLYVPDAGAQNAAIWIKPSGGSYPGTPDETISITAVADEWTAGTFSSPFAVGVGDEVTIGYYRLTKWQYEAIADTTFTPEFETVSTLIGTRYDTGDRTSGAVPASIDTNNIYGLVDITFTT